MPQESTLTHWFVTVDGSDVAGLMESVRRIEVEQHLFLPDMCSITMNDGTRWTDDPHIGLGHTVAVTAHAGPGQDAPAAEVFSGDIVALEGDFQPDTHTSMTIRAYDRSHRLQRGSRSRSWTRISDSDIASRLGSEYGLTVDADATDTVHEHMIQDNVSDFAFLQERARASGRVMTVSGSRLLFKRLERISSGVAELDLGRNLLEFSPRMSASGQVTRVEAKGWDPRTKRTIVGRANSGESTAEQSEWGQRGVDLFRSASGTPAPALYLTDISPADQSAADALAAARLQHLWAGDYRAEGLALGDPRIHAGGRVSIQNQGKFNGEYIVTSARHLYEGGHYTVRFALSGLEAGTTADLVTSAEPAYSRTVSGRVSHGLVVALVTNVRDPEDLGRVKVKFPWLDDTTESNWARVAAPMAGAERGFLFLPEVNDEVLVGFEHGDFNRPFVLGGLWNGVDKPPETAGDVVGPSGEINHRVIKTRAGHIIRLIDTRGKESIEIVDHTGQNKIVIDSSKNKITVSSAADIEFQATQKISLTAMSIEIKGSQSVQVDGAQVQVTGSATTTIKGGVVQIN